MAEYIATSPDGTQKNRVVLPDDYDMSKVPAGVKLEPVQGYVGKLPSEPDRPFQMGLGESFVEGTQDPGYEAERVSRHGRAAPDAAEYERYLQAREENLRARGVDPFGRFAGNVLSPPNLMTEVATAGIGPLLGAAGRRAAGAVSGMIGGATTLKPGGDETEELASIGLGGVAGHAVGGVGSRALTPRVAREDVMALARQNYDQLLQSGATVDRRVIRNLADTIERDLNSRLFDKQSAPDTFRALDRLRTMDWKQHPFQDATVADLDQFGQFLRQQLGGRDRDSTASKAALDMFDNFIGNIPAGAVRSGNPQADAQLLRETQGLWAAGRRAEAIQRADWDAGLRIGSTGTGSNVSNVYRQEARRLLNGPESKYITDPEQRAALEAIARGTFTQNAARYIGKVLAPTGAVSSIPYRLGKEGLSMKAAESLIGIFMKQLGDRLTKYAMRDEADRILAQTGVPARQPPWYARPFMLSPAMGPAAGVLTTDVTDPLASKDALR